MVVEKLHHGEENAMPSSQLVQACGFHSKRTLSKQIEKERAAGAIICSNKDGYYLPKDRKEVQAFINTMTKRATSTLKSIKAARNYMKQFEGQETLNFDEI